MMSGGKVIDADSLQRIQLNARHKEAIRPIIIAEETVSYSPHSFLDPIVKRKMFEEAAIAKLCGTCPDCGDCPISGNITAPIQCDKLRKVMRR